MSYKIIDWPTGEWDQAVESATKVWDWKDAPYEFTSLSEFHPADNLGIALVPFNCVEPGWLRTMLRNVTVAEGQVQRVETNHGLVIIWAR